MFVLKIFQLVKALLAIFYKRWATHPKATWAISDSEKPHQRHFLKKRRSDFEKWYSLPRSECDMPDDKFHLLEDIK